MSRVTITLTIDLPEGIVPNVEYSTDTVPPEPPYLMAPLPIEVDAAAIAAQAFPDAKVTYSGNPARCPIHGNMTRFPAGTNKAGKPYSASWRCVTKDCPTKPIWDRDAA
jgi:hypothetical protein